MCKLYFLTFLILPVIYLLPILQIVLQRRMNEKTAKNHDKNPAKNDTENFKQLFSRIT